MYCNGAGKNTGSDPGCLPGSRAPAVAWMSPPPQALVTGWYLQKKRKKREEVKRNKSQKL